MHSRVGILLVPLLLVGLASGAGEPLVPPADGKPILQLDAGGPMAAVTALAFLPTARRCTSAAMTNRLRPGSR